MPDAVQRIFFLPPLAIARVGGSDTPLDSFAWDSDRTIHGAHRTVIVPAVSLQVQSDGSLLPYLPNAIQFRDHGLLRPVAPFFELWATLNNGKCVPLTSTLLKQLGATTDNVEYAITMANRKAQRRTGSAACAYIARVAVGASDHERKELKAYSPHTSGEEPLVFQDHPISLGHFQALKPTNRDAMNVDLAVLRVRFTPARGKVYGPPEAIAGPASPLPQGVSLPPVTRGGRLHEIVPEENRILNPNTRWSQHIMDQHQDDPQPSDSYDGANVGDNRSWGVVDDTCDGIIEANLVINGRRFIATARVLSTCPDWAPDRRPFYSVADDLADRDLPPVKVTSDTIKDSQYEIADLFERAFETASMFNLDAMRARAIVENRDYYAKVPPNNAIPRIDERSMTSADRGTNRTDRPPPYADLTADMFPYPNNEPTSAPGNRVPYSDAAQFAHAKLSDLDSLIEFLRSEPDRVKSLIRPPFGRFRQLAERRRGRSGQEFRDPRNKRISPHDMRMPPYMRDSDQNPLSLTKRQYDAIIDFVDLLGRQRPVAGRPFSPIAVKIADFIERFDTESEV